MNVQLPVHLDKTAFLAWVQGREERYELVEGRVVMMARPSRAHGMLVLKLASMIFGQLDPQQWTVILEFGLDAGPKTLRYPDIVVDRGGGAPGDYVATAPALLVEVLSPSTAKLDLGDKVAEFLRIPSLDAYLVLAQDEQKAWVWLRGSEGFAAGSHVHEGHDAVIEIAALGIKLPLSEVYAGIQIE